MEHDCEVPVLHERDDWIALNKPAGWHTLAPRSGAAGPDAHQHPPDIESWLRREYAWAAPLEESGLVHRLDRDTSGCLVAAKNPHDAARLRDAFSRPDRPVLKMYIALIGQGKPVRGTFRLHFTSRYRRSRKVTVLDQGDPGNLGVCRYETLHADEAGRLLRVELVGPGRRHQIRAGLAHIGLPIVGDALYGGVDDPFGPHLHAWRLRVDGDLVQAPLPGWARPAADQFEGAAEP